jgi:hypothetical protein
LSYATAENLNFYAPEVYEGDTEDWDSELALAETDIKNMVEVKWYDQVRGGTDFDASKLTGAQWTKATVYQTLVAYVLPKMSTFRVEDTFIEQIKFYQDRLKDELDMQFALGIKYDSDGDGTTTEAETYKYAQTRLYR